MSLFLTTTLHWYGKQPHLQCGITSKLTQDIKCTWYTIDSDNYLASDNYHTRILKTQHLEYSNTSTLTRDTQCIQFNFDRHNHPNSDKHPDRDNHLTLTITLTMTTTLLWHRKQPHLYGNYFNSDTDDPLYMVEYQLLQWTWLWHIYSITLTFTWTITPTWEPIFLVLFSTLTRMILGDGR